MPFSVIYDACLLYPFEIRDILMVAARTRTFAVRWTDAILDEFTRNLIKDGRATQENTQRMIADMKKLYPYATIPLNDYESLIPVMKCEPKDRHILAAAVAWHVDIIVTRNIKDFPAAALEPYRIETQSADEFVRHVLDFDPRNFVRHFRLRAKQRREWAIQSNKAPHSDEEIAKHLKVADPPMPDTSGYLLECLADSRYQV